MMLLDVTSNAEGLPSQALIFILGVCMALIVLLIGIVVFFAKREFKKNDEKFEQHEALMKENKETQEKKNEDHEKLMKELNSTLGDLNINITAMSATVKSGNDWGKLNTKQIEEIKKDIKVIDSEFKKHVSDNKIHNSA